MSTQITESNCIIYTEEMFDPEDFDESTCKMELRGEYNGEDYKDFIQEYGDLENFNCESVIIQLMKYSKQSKAFFLNSLQNLNDMSQISRDNIEKAKELFSQISENFAFIIAIGKFADQIVFNLSKLENQGFVPPHSIREANEFCAQTYAERISMYKLFMHSKDCLMEFDKREA